MQNFFTGIATRMPAGCTNACWARPTAPRRAEIARRLVLLNLVADDRDAALKFYEVYKGAGGGD